MVLGKVSVNRIYLLAFLSFFAITGITFFKTALELEDAEQAYYSQWLRWGFDDQPPLYTWFQFTVNQIFGIHKVSFSLFRGAIFASILLLMWQLSRKMIKHEKKAELAVFGLVLLPVFIDFTFRRLSHTSLLCASVVASYIILQRLIHQKTWGNYALFGLIVSIGFLSKYNYVLFLAALGLVLFFDASLRRIVLNKKMLLTVFLVVVLIFPHFYWLLGPDGYLTELRESIGLKTENVTENTLFIIGPLFSLLLNLLKLIAPFLVVVAICLRLKKIRFQRSKLDWFVKLGLTQLVILVLFFVVLDIQKVEERWLLPLVLPFIVLLLRSLEFKSIRKWSTSGFALFLIIISLQVLRTPAEKVLGIPSSVHFGFEQLSLMLENDYREKQWILPDVTYGGNIRLLNPEREVFSKDDFSLPQSKLQDINGVEVILKEELTKDKILLDSILDFGKERDTLYIIEFNKNIDSR